MDEETQAALSMAVHIERPTVTFQAWQIGTSEGSPPITVTCGDAKVWLVAMLKQVQEVMGEAE
jgi:hypothetical protein